MQTISKFSLSADNFTVSLLAALSRQGHERIEIDSCYVPAACAAKAFVWLKQTYGNHFDFQFHVLPSKTWGSQNWAIALRQCMSRGLLDESANDRFSYILNHDSLQEAACGTLATAWSCSGQSIGEFFAIWDGAASIYLAEQEQLLAHIR